MKILFLAPRLPYPADTGGKIRTLNILKQLAKKAQIHLVCFSFEPQDHEFSETFKKMGIKVSLVTMQEPNFLIKSTELLLNAMPYSMSKYFSVSMKTFLSSLKEKESFDALHADHLHMTYYRDGFNDLPCVVDEHNVEYMILKRCAQIEHNYRKKIIFLDQSQKMKSYEARQIGKFTRYLAVSEDDKNILERLIQGKIKGEVIPNGVDTEFFKTIDDRPETIDQESKSQVSSLESLVFTGSLDWLPNEDAVLFFCKEILPLIWRSNPEAKFYVVGKGATQKLLELSQQDKRIVMTGRVDDVRPFIAKSQVFVVPIRVGGGTRLKILEAMAMEKAVVSTTVGAEGIQHTKGKDILLADEPQDFADKVVSLLNNPSKRQEMGEAGRELVCRLYDWNIIGERLNAIYREITHV